jgi:serine protease
MRQLIRIFQVVSFLAFCAHATAQPTPLPSPTVARVIVKFKDDGNFLRQAAGLQRSLALSTRLGLSITQGHEIAKGHQVLTSKGLSSEQLADRLSQLDEVEFAEPDALKKINAFTNDPVFPNQWYLQNTQASASNFTAAWELGTGAGQTVVAVLDTGITDHPDLRNKLVPGYNFISDPVLAMNGMGRSANPTDPGDYIDAAVRNDPAFVSGCGAENLVFDTHSSWHGTQVAGLIAAQTNNAYGMAGAGWDLRILPVRTLGKCGGRDSDILAAMLWAAGIPVPGVPNNPYPARIINLSLGSATPCSKSYASVLAQLAGKAVVVAAAGNDGGPVGSPANCAGVLAVAGLRHQGDKVGYSSYGKEVGISAPAGNCINTEVNQPCLFPLQTTTNSGLKGPVEPAMTDEFNYTVGTSFSAPLVSAAVALMVDLNPALTPAETTAKIKVAAKPFVQVPGRPVCESSNDLSPCNCTSAVCGSGMLDALSALRLASPQALAVPESGWWWNSNESGSGYSVEIQGNRLFLAAFTYAPDGRAVWHVAAGTLSPDGRFVGDLTEYAGGQSLVGPYRAAQAKGNVMPMQLECDTPVSCKISLGARRIDITRFRYDAAEQAAKAPETGWWWNPDESGRGFFIERQGSTLFLAGYMYDSAGNAVWYIASGSTTELSLGTSWSEYAYGQTLTGPYQAARLKSNAAGTLKWVFSSPQTAVLTLPGGRAVSLQRFEF